MALTSVWEGNDRDLLMQAIPLYLRREPSLVLDVTWGSGKWWRDSRWPVVGMDKFTPAEVKGDYQVLPFGAAVADVVVFDPPHRSAGGPNRSRLLEDRFGSVGYRPEGLLSQLPPFYREVRRVLRDEGICLTKIADQVHWHRMVWHQVEAVVAGRGAGLCACDMIIKTRSHPIVSSKWEHRYHAWKRHAFWVVFRKGGCEPRVTAGAGGAS